MTAPTLPARRTPAPPPLGPAPVWERDQLFQEPAFAEGLQPFDEDDDEAA
ncbi:hypothetical protein [Streptomyces bottropensis]